MKNFMRNIESNAVGMVEVKQFDAYAANETHVFTMGWDKPVYIKHDGAVRACRFIALSLGFDNVENGYSKLHQKKPIYVCEIAGMEERGVFVWKNHKVSGMKIYETKEDAVADKPVNEYSQPVFSLCEILMDCFDVEDPRELGVYREFPIHDGRGCSITRWKWNGTDAVQVPLVIEDRIIYHKHNGFEFVNPEPFETMMCETYGTKNECINENRVNVVEFDDEEREEEDGIDLQCFIGDDLIAGTLTVEEAVKLKAFLAAIFTARALNDLFGPRE